MVGKVSAAWRPRVARISGGGGGYNQKCFGARGGVPAEEMTLAVAVRKLFQRVERTDVRFITKLSFNVYF